MNTLSDKEYNIKNKPTFFPANKKMYKEINNTISCFIAGHEIQSMQIIGNPKNIEMDSNSLNILINLTNNKKYLLKKIPLKNIALDSLYRISSIMNWVKDYGILVPKLYKSLNENYFEEYEESYWMLMEYIDGTFFSGNITQFNQTALSCSKLLNALSELPDKYRPLKHKESYFTDYEIEIFSKLKKSQYDWVNIFGERFAQKLYLNWDYIFNQWLFINSHSFIKKKYNSVIHHDLHPQNFIVANKKIFIIDYDSVVIGAPQSAIGFSIIRMIKHLLDISSKDIRKIDVSLLGKEWITTVDLDFHLFNDNNEVEIFGRAEVFRRFLSMTNKAFLNIPSSFNGPETHLDSLFVADKIFGKPNSI